MLGSHAWAVRAPRLEVKDSVFHFASAASLQLKVGLLARYSARKVATKASSDALNGPYGRP